MPPYRGSSWNVRDAALESGHCLQEQEAKPDVPLHVSHIEFKISCFGDGPWALKWSLGLIWTSQAAVALI